MKLPSRQLTSQQNASLIERAQVPRSRFQGSWTRKTAFDAGYLVPIMVDEILPGDHMAYDVTAYVRMSTPLFPMMDNQRIDTFFFFVPNRLLWDNWAKFMGEQINPGDSINYTVPVVDAPAAMGGVGTIWDHMGIPNVAATTTQINTLPLRAYNRIWNEWFRDQNIQSSITQVTTDGPDAEAWYTLKRRNKAHDYFTSALPWPQKFTGPTLPLAGLAPVIGIGHSSATMPNAGPHATTETASTGSYDYWKYANTASTFAIDFQGNTGVPAIYADLANATGVSIDTMREAWMIQSLLERDARGGTRYTELIKAHFGVVNPDFRLQRSEYIGGGQTPLQLTPIAQTAPDAGSVVGQLGAAGTAAGTHRASFAATEHGYILGLINVRSELSYQQGLHKMWKRQTRYDFYWPAFAGLGEQVITLSEIYHTNTATDAQTFGYQERHHEYRTRYSEVTGIMRSSAAGTLDAWHLAQNFSAAPSLSTAFIQEDPPMARILAAGALAEDQQYIADIMFRRTATRPIPTFGTPVTLGRF